MQHGPAFPAVVIGNLFAADGVQIVMHATIRAVRPAATSILVLLLITACARSAAPSGSPASTEADTSDRPARSIRPLQTPPASDETVIGEVPQEILDAILADAADRSGAALAAIEVVTAEQVTWPDGSLGCPEPGQAYTQALVDGYQVVVDAGGEELDYRVGSGGSFQLCENGLPRGG
jgi:hypothetical protein